MATCIDKQAATSPVSSRERIRVKAICNKRWPASRPPQGTGAGIILPLRVFGRSSRGSPRLGSRWRFPPDSHWTPAPSFSLGWRDGHGQSETQTPSIGLQHPSLEEGAGKRCSECVRDPNSKHWFTTSFRLQPLPYLVMPQGPENCQLTNSFSLVLKQ